MSPADLGGLADAASAMAPVAAPAAAQVKNSVVTSIGLGAGGLATLASVVYFVYRRFQSDGRTDASAGMQQELFVQLQAAADQHLKSVKEINTMLEAERLYSATLAQRLVDQQKAWAEERRLFEDERRTLLTQLSESQLKVEAMNSELTRMGEQVRHLSDELNRSNGVAPQPPALTFGSEQH